MPQGKVKSSKEAGSLGEKLFLAREEKGLTLDEVNNRIRVHPRILNQLETNDFESVTGGKIYCKAFLRQYAQFLELNTEEIMAEFDALGLREREIEFSIGLQKTEDPKKKIQNAVAPLIQNKEQISKISARILIGIAALLVFWAGIKVAFAVAHATGAKWQEFQVNREARRLEKEELKAQKAQEAARKAASEERKPAQQPAPVKKNTAERPAPIANVPVPATLTAANIVPNQVLNNVEMGNFPAIKSNQELVLQASAETDVWLRVVADGKIIFESILKKGDANRWIADKYFELKLGRPAGVDLEINGFLLGKPGNGQAKNVRLTREGMFAS